MSSRVAPPACENGRTNVIEDGDKERLAELNGELAVLATAFPRILPEALREMLQTFDGESRLHIVAEELLKHQDGWVKDRWRKAIQDTDKAKNDQLPVTAEDCFRRASYKKAVRTTLYEEFKALSKSKIEGVLAEENFCYTRARLTLQNVASKNWRNSFNVFVSRLLRSAKFKNEDHYILVWPKNHRVEANSVPYLKETGDGELDAELYQNVLLPFLQKSKKEREEKDWETAVTLNEAEALDAQAIHFCQHFRPTGGVCRECDKCDLYLNEDDENLVKRAGALAEKEWRVKEGMTGVAGIGGGQEEAPRATWLYADWTMQDLIDWWVKKVIDC
ncbi:MAG: hypothetical protein ASARMPRED_003993 [Alectoria sarmentosa]|nr:MAG: hypothetical protein ASARMPRED_003993 [Alectoria sarmentosa]